MRAPSFTKYGFRIRTRVGVVVDNLLIHGQDEADAKRKLCQMYHDCEILECVCREAAARPASPANYEDVLGMITR